MNKVQPAEMPVPKGHYSPGVVANGFVFVSGMLPIDPASGAIVDGGVEAQTERTLRNVELVLRAAGSSLDRIVQMTVYIPDGELWGAVNTTYARVMGSHRPTRAIVPVSPLHYGALIEIQAIALAPGTQ
ncbi:MAG TPA: RidA family protein [Gemmatimonadales bacterium]|nr:RidA family protein [Gemmatimonadales bacterium]